MRVIAGKCKRMPLSTIAGSNTRPTTDRIKETLFNILAPQMYQCRFLDLFAGSGQIGIEALSRGGEHAVFVEKSHQAVSCIRKNLHFTGLQDQAEIFEEDAAAACRRLDARCAADASQAFDVIFMDPPYHKALEQELLTLLSQLSILKKDGLIVVEASLETEFSYAEPLGFVVERQKKYKTNQHVFLRKG